MDEHSERALVRVGTYGGAPSALRLEIAGPGVREAVAVPPTYADGAVVSVPVDPPRDPVVAQVCIRNQGNRQVALYAGADRYSRSETRVDGAPVRGNFELAFAEAGEQTLAARLPAAVERMQGFRLGTPWLDVDRGRPVPRRRARRRGVGVRRELPSTPMSTSTEQAEIAALQARVEQLERENAELATRANAAIAAAQDRAYWLDRWGVDLNALMRRRGASEFRAGLRGMRAVARALKHVKQRLGR